MSLSNQSSPSPLTFKCGRVLWERNASLGFGLMRRGRGLEYDVSVNPLHMCVCVCHWSEHVLLQILCVTVTGRTTKYYYNKWH